MGEDDTDEVLQQKVENNRGCLRARAMCGALTREHRAHHGGGDVPLPAGTSLAVINNDFVDRHSKQCNEVVNALKKCRRYQINRANPNAKPLAKNAVIDLNLAAEDACA